MRLNLILALLGLRGRLFGANTLGKDNRIISKAAYSVLGRNPKIITNPFGETLTYSYDGFGRVTTLTNSQGHQIKYAYDAMGNVTKVTDANGNATEYTYDVIGQLISKKDPEGFPLSLEH